MFIKGDVYLDDEGGVWTVDYEGLSCCKNDVVAFDGHINGRAYGWTCDKPEAYAIRAAGTLRKRGQMDLFSLTSNYEFDRQEGKT